MPLNMDDLHSSVGKQTAYKRACRQIFKPCHICPRIRSPYGSSSEETTGRLRTQFGTQKLRAAAYSVAGSNGNASREGPVMLAASRRDT